MLGYDEAPISIETIYGYEVELPLRIPALYGKQTSLSFFFSYTLSHLCPSAAPEEWGLL